MTNIKDVAKAADVSISTVSNIINNKNNVSLEVYNRVLKVMDNLNYSPNLLARNLKKNKTKFIGVILPNLDRHYSQMLEGIQRVAEYEGYNIIIKLTNDVKNFEEKYLDELVNNSVKGILIVTCNETNIDRFKDISSRKIPLVFMERYIHGEDFNSVIFDSEKIIYNQTVKLLKSNRDNFSGNLSKSYDDIILIMGPEEFRSERDFKNGFFRAMSEYNKNITGKTLSLHLSWEYAFKELVNYISSLSAMADCFISTNSTISESLHEVLGLFGYKSDIFTISEESWFHYGIGDSETSDSFIRQSILLGSTSAGLLIDCFKSPLTFENRQIIIKEPKESIEKHIRFYESGSKGKINLLLLEGPTSEAVLKLLPNFKKDLSIEVDFEKLQYVDLYNRIVEQNKKSLNDFDIFMIDLPWISSFVENNYLVKLDDFIHQEDDEFIPGFIDYARDTFIKRPEGIFTIPIMIGIQMLFYRSDFFEDSYLQKLYFNEYGIDLQPPKTWTEFNLIARFFTRKYNGNSPVEYGTSIAGLKPTGIIEEFLTRQWAYNGRIISDDKELVIDSIENIKAVNNLYDTYCYSAPESIDFWWDDQINEFVKGNVAIISTFNSHVSGIYDRQMENMISNVKYEKVPGGNPMLGGWSFGINKFSGDPENSYKFIKWACGEKLSVHNTFLGGFVPRKSVIDNINVQIKYPWVKNISRYLKASRKREIIRNREGKILDIYLLEEIFADKLIDVLTGKTSAENALKDAKAEFARMIG